MPIVAGDGQKFWSLGLPFNGIAKATGIGGTRFFYADYLTPEGTLSFELSALGGYVFNGLAVIDAVTYSVSYSVIGLGGYLFGSEANIIRSQFIPASGGYVFGAAADFYTEYSLLVDGSGSYIFGGSGDTSFDFLLDTLGGFIFGGAAGFAIPSDMRYLLACVGTAEEPLSICETFQGDGVTSPRSGLCRWGTTESYPEDSEWA